MNVAKTLVGMRDEKSSVGKAAKTWVESCRKETSATLLSILKIMAADMTVNEEEVPLGNNFSCSFYRVYPGDLRPRTCRRIVDQDQQSLPRGTKRKSDIKQSLDSDVVEYDNHFSIPRCRLLLCIVPDGTGGFVEVEVGSEASSSVM